MILAMCPMKEIEGEILEAEHLTDKITQLRLEISSVVPNVDISGAKSTKGVTGSKKTHESTETCESVACINKTGAPDGSGSNHKSTSPTVVTDSENKHESTSPIVVTDKGEREGAAYVVKPKLPKLT